MEWPCNEATRPPIALPTEVPTLLAAAELGFAGDGVN